MAAPCALIASCCEYDPQNIVKHILNVSELPAGQPVVESVLSYPWHIDTKYYTADVNLCTTSSRTIGDEDFAVAVQAFVVYFDTHEEASFQRVSSWLPYLAHINPAVQILVCKTNRHEDVVSRQRSLEWCIKHGFELVELEPEVDSDDEDDDFAETVGPKRIIQALHAHTWPNLKMKNRPPMRSPYFRNLMQEEAALKLNPGAPNGANERSDAGPVPADSTTATPAMPSPSSPEEAAAVRTAEGTGAQGGAEERKGEDGADTKMTEGGAPDPNEMAILAALGNEDPGEESFEQLFARLQVMKDKASTLPSGERKSYAEQMAVTFWRAIGGDEDEIDGLFDDLDPDQEET